MNTQCTPTDFHFESLSVRQIVARFDGGTITSDGGALVLQMMAGDRPGRVPALA